ncbi:hypothetical protein [Azospirillum sp. TSA6c]|uniref:hypothetical protein n=1 Tax=unclassified Azospirillum TaxID=2630922 RepID=UPI0011B7A60F|nr:hypothetical protein [Azospirillum sp. TSA6c]
MKNDVDKGHIVVSFNWMFIDDGRVVIGMALRVLMLDGSIRTMQLLDIRLVETGDILNAFALNGRHKDEREQYIREDDPVPLPAQHPLIDFVANVPVVSRADVAPDYGKAAVSMHWEEYSDCLSLTVEYANGLTGRYIFNESIAFILRDYVNQAVRYIGVSCRPSAEQKVH